MSFDTFDNSLAGYRDFLASKGKSTDVRWLSRSHARIVRRRLYVLRPINLHDSSAAHQRFERALRGNKNIAFCWYGSHEGLSMVSLETEGLDPPNDAHEESGSHNYKVMTKPYDVVAVNSVLYWQYAKLKSSKSTNQILSLGWPP